jgi:hypothetical protein
MPIDYGRLVSRTWEVFSRNRVLWLLGLIIALTSGGFNSQFNYSTSSNNVTEIRDFFDQYGGLLLTLGCIALIVGIIFTFIRAAGEAALIAATDHIERTREQPSFSAAWGLGWPKMFPVWLFNLVFGILIAILFLIFLVPLFLLFGASIGAAISASSNGDTSGANAIGGALGLLCLCGCISLLILIPLSIILGLAREYGVRAVVLDNEGPVQAIGTGWQMVRANPGPSFVVFLITVAVGVIASVILAPVALFIGVPMMASLGINNGQFSLPTLLILGVLLWLISAAVGTFTTSFQSVLWTLLYRNRRQMPGSELAPAGMMPPGGGTPYGAPYGAAPPYTPTGSPPPYTPPAGSPPPYTPPAGSPPPYTPPPGSALPYSPPAGSPPPYTPPAESPSAYPPPAESSSAYPPPAESSSAYTPPAYTPPAYTPPSYTPPAESSGTIQYGAPPPYTPPPGETRPIPPPPPESERGPSGPLPDDRARGPEGGSGT